MTRFPLRITERIKTRRKEKKKEKKKKKKDSQWRGVYPKGVTLTLVSCILHMVKLT